ncbi:hypothetical protein M378DRAFT_213566 [Amanita muscaria Koide BX008]|uniref:Uncharacterized protein n=1 Tax=Amanita muscaria (strain Koide BX008) TaxID=946122 RepID=A0A0C2T5U7_AMAMK|nr:hypothetical protein M378DRAFT_213566 [Amanita muscaria Koide BX008]
MQQPRTPAEPTFTTYTHDACHSRLFPKKQDESFTTIAHRRPVKKPFLPFSVLLPRSFHIRDYTRQVGNPHTSSHLITTLAPFGRVMRRTSVWNCGEWDISSI